MNWTALLDNIANKYKETGITIHPPATTADIEKAEAKMRLSIPADLKEFYSICNGFDCVDDKFAIVRVRELFRDDEYGHEGIIFAERMVYEQVWAIRNLPDGRYEIFFNEDEEITLTESLADFFGKLLAGHTKGQGGLLAWHQ